MENMITTAINILATFLRVLSWLSKLRLAEFMLVTMVLDSSLVFLRLTNLIVVFVVLEKMNASHISMYVVLPGFEEEIQVYFEAFKK